ncbi:DUF302 domain-containing protein [Paenarthrobacter sp. DKR-5]|uniref:DUF302 domain-containing protein n=1 Tax=Paenarthrobacter sp. DKR-5 TaxID=2835535 RepID=UPI001BDCDCAB|nr:DUF302 domain-containing protein [Paenarthrobacter sp. DKR-5]MBT1004401.1 DUF302 domain-containing protein [Paenarthrobacter sp. DKR-5]
MEYAHTITVPAGFEETVTRTREALATQGFGVLTEIDVNATFTAKLGAEAGDAVGSYLILGACNPPLAQRAIAADSGIGALLPCNVVIRRAAGDTATTVQAIDPMTMVQLSGQPAIQEVAAEADRRLQAALSTLGETSR